MTLVPTALFPSGTALQQTLIDHILCIPKFERTARIQVFQSTKKLTSPHLTSQVIKEEEEGEENDIPKDWSGSAWKDREQEHGIYTKRLVHTKPYEYHEMMTA